MKIACVRHKAIVPAILLALFIIILPLSVLTMPRAAQAIGGSDSPPPATPDKPESITPAAIPPPTFCWCDAGSGSYKKAVTSSQADCQNLCTNPPLNQKFVFWGTTAPPSPGSVAPGGSAVKCPPGGIWTEPDCKNAKNSAGALIGVWKAPPGQASGPYCYYNDAPINLGVGLGTLTQANLSQYLAAAYQLGLGIAAVLAVIFIMIGGFRYMSAAGGAGVEEGKGMIKNAVIGLVLAALSYTLLLTVNPDILSLRLPSIQLIKACDIGPVDCGSRPKETCEDNSADPSKKCSWDITGSKCIDLSTTQSGNTGQVGGACQVDAAGNKTCATGGCVQGAGGLWFCSSGGACQPCGNTLDCSAGFKCISNQCSIPNINNPPAPGSTTDSNDHYILCTNAFGCTSDTQCATGEKCGGKHSCIATGQGTDCLTNGQDDCGSGFTCHKWYQSDPSLVWNATCCLNDKADGCLGCGSDGQCAKNMYCLTSGQSSFLSSKSYAFDPSFVGRCVSMGGGGSPCNATNMCVSGVCTGGSCK